MQMSGAIIRQLRSPPNWKIFEGHRLANCLVIPRDCLHFFSESTALLIESAPDFIDSAEKGGKFAKKFGPI